MKVDFADVEEGSTHHASCLFLSFEVLFLMWELYCLKAIPRFTPFRDLKRFKYIVQGILPRSKLVSINFCVNFIHIIIIIISIYLHHHHNFINWVNLHSLGIDFTRESS